ncbi:hypothetical protein [Acuticoccus sp.]|uniref:hypothetical protein n=1 Tax=Acuticoccus sp. TaxID=1904378 RepID=UPI003B52BF09
MRRRLAVLALAALVSACAAPQLTGIATGLAPRMAAPARPLAEPATATFAFAPFPGIPGNISDDLLVRIWQRAEREGLNVVKRPGGRALFTVEGTLTAVSDDNNAVLFYVFDVHDVAGRRLHRISGRKRSNASDGDPWASVQDADLDVIARRLAALLRAWLYADA